ncbi:MAG: sigma 54-interacting transcriptional regulator [Gemmatimonadaceae bacterium]|nr:sigma 54-interacting transcriptional regulator [Gemmatimonadaceae bacterium]
MRDTVPLPLTGTSTTMRALAARDGELRRDTTRPVLIAGARGLGKHHLARGIHAGSEHRNLPLLELDARHAAAGDLHQLVTGAPDGTTLLLRHVDRLPLAAQQELEERTRQRGRIVRLLATTTADIVALVNAGAFSESLYYRLHAWPMLLPALAAREAGDLLALASAILAQTADGDPGLPVSCDPAAESLLSTRPWDENLRELEATLALAQMRARGQAHIGAAHLAPTAADGDVPPATATLAEVERWHLLRALALCRGNRTHAARQLGISRMTLITRLKQAGATAMEAS